MDMTVIKGMGILEEEAGPMVREEVGGVGVGIINLLLFSIIAVICNNHFSYIYVYYILVTRDR